MLIDPINSQCRICDADFNLMQTPSGVYCMECLFPMERITLRVSPGLEGLKKLAEFSDNPWNVNPHFLDGPR